MGVQLSIIIPIYNAEKYLYKNVLSIINQDVDIKLYEVILINDGSTDSSEKICIDLANRYSNIKYYYQKNSGVSVARNNGIKHSNGKYICFVDSDDYVSNNYVKTILDVSKNNKFCILDNFLVKNSKIRKEKKWLSKQFDSYIEKNKIMDWLIDNKFNAPWDKIYLKEIIDNNKISFMPGINMGEDLLFNIDYINYCEKVFISKETIYFHVINKNGLCNRKVNLEQFDEICNLYEELKKRIFNLQDENYFINKINIVFLRNIINYFSRLLKSGYSLKEIKGLCNKNDMIKSILMTKVVKLKDIIRIFLLNMFFKH